jgi:hypothetical protein
MRVPYYCPYCNQRSTRRWNLDVHIKRRHGGSSGPNMTNHPQFGHATIPGSLGNTFEYKDGRQQTPLAVSQFSASPMYQPRQIMDDPSNRTGLSQDNIIRIQELKRLAYKYRQYQNNDPDVIVEWAVQGASKGDNTFLDNKLEQLRIIDLFQG